MSLPAAIAIAFVAAQHLAFLVLEMFLWEHPVGRRVFRQSAERAAMTRVLAMNQGLYNGFLAAGLLWSLWLGAEGTRVALFFLTCVIVAGLFGGATVNRRIVLIQAGPAAVAIVLLLTL